MKTVDKEKELNNYIREWIDARYCDWSTFYHDVQINKRSGIYLLKRGCELFDFLSNIVANIEEHLIAGKSCHIIPSKFSSIDQFLCFVRNFKQYISDNYHLLEINMAGDDTSYMVITMYEIIDAVNNMVERCLDIYLREEHTPEPYSLMRRSLAKGEIETFMTTLEAVVSDIPYGIRKKAFNEAYFHIIVHVITSVLGFEPVSEKETSNGRIDLTMRFSGFVYIFEFKYTDENISCAETALQQIKDKRYADSYKHLQHEIVCVGVSFSKEKRGINGYEYCKIPSNRIL